MTSTQWAHDASRNRFVRHDFSGPTLPPAGTYMIADPMIHILLDEISALRSRIQDMEVRDEMSRQGKA